MTAPALEPQASLRCQQCAIALLPGNLVCQNCGRLVYAVQLNELAAQALRLEAVDPLGAARYWHDCLAYLPPDAPQAQQLNQRIELLVNQSDASEPVLDYAPAAYTRTLGSSFTRTGGSMLLSMAIYAAIFGPPFAVGFVLLILIHEMGHVLALKHFGIRSSPPLFIPFLGAVITVPQMKNVYEEAIVGIGGPIFGMIGSLICLGAYHTFQQDVLLELAFYGGMMNLFNLLPIPPLDGGRVTAAISPWIWPFGIAAIAALAIFEIHTFGSVLVANLPILAIITVFSLPRLWQTLKRGGRSGPYYRISRASSVWISISYVLLALVLVGMVMYSQSAGDMFQ